MILTISYVVLLFLRPDYFWPEIAPYRPMLWLGSLALVISFFLSGRRALVRAQQTYLLVALAVAMVVSEVAGLWFGGIFEVANKFYPSVVVFCLVMLNVTTLKRIRIFAAALVLVALSLVALGIAAYHFGYNKEQFLFMQRVEDRDHNYIGENARLTGGAGFLQDPNDFGQFLLTVLPITALAWKRRRRLSNLLRVILPSGIILYAVFLTHSRGALLGCGIVALIALRPRLGTIGSGLVTAVLLAGLVAMNFSGGRAVSAEAGADRLEAWSEGLQMFKTAPVFGVGFGRFNEHNSITAHNSFVLCMAELGVFGFGIWLMLLIASVQDLNRLIRPNQLRIDNNLELAMESAANERNECITKPLFRDETELRRCAYILRLSLLSFVATAWFLSRTYVPLLYMLIALVASLASLNNNGDDNRSALVECRHLVRWALISEVAMIAIVYTSVQVRF